MRDHLPSFGKSAAVALRQPSKVLPNSSKRQHCFFCFSASVFGGDLALGVFGENRLEPDIFETHFRSFEGFADRRR